MKIIIFTMIIILLSGCASKDIALDRGSIYEQPQRQQGIFESSRYVTDLAKKDVSVRFNLPENSIKVDTVIPVEWTDTSLGYPEPGKEIGKDYPLETIKGYTILLSSNGKLYEYHSDYYRIVPPNGPVKTIQ